MVDEATLLAAPRGSVVAPAGCGKTELIARAATRPEGAGALILTHTHSGVKAIRDRLRRLGVDRSRVRVETIAGWCLRYARAYPATAQLPSVEPVKQEWNSVYEGALRLLKVHALQRVVRATYSRVFVDEYQDCTARQHAVIVALANHLPTCVLGDPLQGIFSFAGGSLRWTSEVEGVFPRLGTLTEPWRWRGRNEPLGKWLLDLRSPLTNGERIDLVNAPLQWMASTLDNQRAAAYGLANGSGSVVAIRKWPRDAHAFARSLGGIYPSMEEVDCTDLLKFADEVDQLAGPSRAARLVRLASECFTGVGTALAAVQDKLDSGVVPDVGRYKKIGTIVAALAAVAHGTEPLDILLAMRRIEGLAGTKLFRRELWREAVRTIVAFSHGQFPTLRQTAWNLRNRQRATGRSVEARSVSRTLLIKGLEFDHALVLDAEEFEDIRNRGDGARHFYVAVTRGARSLTVLSANTFVQFGAPLM